MLSGESPNTETDISHHCRLCKVGSPGCKSAPSVNRHASPRIHRIRPECTVQKDDQFDSSTMSVSSDHAYLAKPNHRRSVTLDYRSLAGMTPKWYANFRRKRSVSCEKETANVDKQLEVTVQNSTETSTSGVCEVVGGEESGHRDKTELLSMLCSDKCQTAVIENSQNSIDCSEAEPILTQLHLSLNEKCDIDRSYMLNAEFSDHTEVMETPLAAVTASECTETAVIAHNIDNQLEVTVQNSTESSASELCEVVRSEESGHCDKTELLSTLCSDKCQAAVIENHQDSIDCSEAEAILTQLDLSSNEKCNIDRSYMLNAEFSDHIEVMETPLAAVTAYECTETAVIAHNIDKQLEVTTNSTETSVSELCEVVMGKESGHCDNTELLSSDKCQADVIQNRHNSIDCSEAEAILTQLDLSSNEKCDIDRSYMLNAEFSDHTEVLETPLAAVTTSECTETAVIAHKDKQHIDKQTQCSLGCCHVNKAERDSEGGTRVLSNVIYTGAVSCSSVCDCDSNLLSAECETDEVQKCETDMDDSSTYAGFFGCDGSHKMICDLHLCGAVETILDSVDSASSVIDEQSACAVDISQQDDFVDNICVDCGCELTSDDLTDCAYSVPVCSVCSQDVNQNVPTMESTASADHDYAHLLTSNLVHPPGEQNVTSLPREVVLGEDSGHCDKTESQATVLEATPTSPSAKCQQPEMPDVDVVDDATFLSFPSKLQMHKYISYQQHVCDPAVRSAWVELARCGQSWHGGHKPRWSAWFGSMRHHRHKNRFSAHDRLNEQVELGLVRPVLTQNSTDFLGIKLETSLSQNLSLIHI